MQKIDCFIPARGGSKGIKNKNLVKIHGKSLIRRALEIYCSSKYIRDVYVSSDSDKILQEASLYGAKPIKRQKTLSGDNVSSEDVIHEFLLNNPSSEHFIFAQCTSPNISTSDVNSAIEKYFDLEFDSLFSSSIFEGFIWKDDLNLAQGLNHNEKIPRQRRQDLPKQYIENGAFYIFNSRKFITLKNRFFGKIGTYCTKAQYLDIDSKEDLALAHILLK